MVWLGTIAAIAAVVAELGNECKYGSWRDATGDAEDQLDDKSEAAHMTPASVEARAPVAP